MSPKPPVLVLVASLALPAFAEEPPKAAPKDASPVPQSGGASPECPAPTAAPGKANMVVAKDPETGRLRPATAAEREKLLGRKPLVAPEQRPVVVLPDGSLMVELGPEDMSYAVAKKNPDGSISQSCVHGADAATKKVTSAPAPKAPTAAAGADR